MKPLITLLLITCLINLYSQDREDSLFVSSEQLQEVVIFGEKKVKSTRLGFLDHDNFTFSMYLDYEIGVFIPNDEGFSKINDVILKINNELSESCEVILNFYQFDKRPTALIESINASIQPSSRKIQTIVGDIIDVEFPAEGVFVSLKIKTALNKDNSAHLRIYLTKKYPSNATYLRGSNYGNEWLKLSELNLDNADYINACFGLYGVK